MLNTKHYIAKVHYLI